MNKYQWVLDAADKVLNSTDGACHALSVKGDRAVRSDNYFHVVMEFASYFMPRSRTRAEYWFGDPERPLSRVSEEDVARLNGIYYGGDSGYGWADIPNRKNQAHRSTALCLLYHILNDE